MAISAIKIRMYKTGTGDCFALKFLDGNDELFSMMIDAGTWKGTKSHLTPFVKDLKGFLGNRTDILVVTHEHKDHVHLFDACENLFTQNFKAESLWLAWTEDDSSKKVKTWKKEYGQKKRALGLAAGKIAGLMRNKTYQRQFNAEFGGENMFEARKQYSTVLNDFAALHFSLENDNYTGGLKGMENVKKKIQKNETQFLSPGNIVEDGEKYPGVRFYVLGPPELVSAVKKEKGRKGSGETYDHNKELEKSGAFSAALVDGETHYMDVLPFKKGFVDQDRQQQSEYEKADVDWRRIDHDWLFSAGYLALRMNSATNNLSLALAIELVDSGKVLLFPGDAEYGSWASWHDIDWETETESGKHLTEDLLNRTIFYKTAHHLSNNGTANEQGMKMMIHEDLMVMATLDYDCIGHGWKSTMPNRALLKDIITQSKGRFIVMNQKDLFYDFKGKKTLAERIEEEQRKMSLDEREAYNQAYVETELYHELTVQL